ncbi:MAG: type III pantothenate kinase [Armatimonadota bacterium]|jgi:type III pantothenate kinase
MSGWRLYADAGNTALKWAVRSEGRWAAEGRIEVGALPTAGRELAGVLALAGFDAAECDGAALVSSRPGQSSEAEQVLAAATGQEVRLLGRDLRADVAVGYHEPSELGQDRLALAEGALALAGAPVIVVAMGTCITAQALDARGILAGGAIAAGLEAQAVGIAAAVPHLRAPVLAALDLLRAGEPLPRIGRSTVENLALGLGGSVLGTVEYLTAAMREGIGEAPVIVTGGDAALVERFGGRRDHVEPRLVLEGLRVIDERTCGD